MIGTHAWSSDPEKSLRTWVTFKLCISLMLGTSLSALLDQGPLWKGLNPAQRSSCWLVHWSDLGRSGCTSQSGRLLVSAQASPPLPDYARGEEKGEDGKGAHSMEPGIHCLSPLHYHHGYNVYNLITGSSILKTQGMRF